MNTEDFYAILDADIRIDATLRRIIADSKKTDNGFYELCMAFAHANDEYEQPIPLLRKQVLDFCQQHQLILNRDLSMLINEYYRQLLSLPTSYTIVTDDDSHKSACDAWLMYNPGLSEDVMASVFGEAWFENEGGKDNE